MQRKRPHTAHRARIVTAAVSAAAFLGIGGVLAAARSGATTTTTDTHTSTSGTTGTGGSRATSPGDDGNSRPWWGSDGGSDDGGSWGATPAPSAPSTDQQGPSTFSHGS